MTSILLKILLMIITLFRHTGLSTFTIQLTFPVMFDRADQSTDIDEAEL